MWGGETLWFRERTDWIRKSLCDCLHLQAHEVLDVLHVQGQCSGRDQSVCRLMGCLSNSVQGWCVQSRCPRCWTSSLTHIPFKRLWNQHECKVTDCSDLVQAGRWSRRAQREELQSRTICNGKKKNSSFTFKWKHKCNSILLSMFSQSQTVVDDNNVSWKIIMTLGKRGKIIMQHRAHDLRFGSKSSDFHFIPTNLWKQIWGLSAASHCGWELIRVYWY